MDDLTTRIRECLPLSGWAQEIPGDQESLREAGMDSLAMALWIVEVERVLKVKLPMTEIIHNGFDTIFELSEIVRSEKKK